tara:strand:- start:85 stop:1191 length:1107 start_codon:yes stop_codon:yes gene_type:complete
MSKKRGQIQVQFNWIFILIVGALILLFFLGVVRTQKKLSDTKISATISTDLRAILSGVEVSTQTAALIDIPKTEIDFNCEGYSVGGLAGMRPTASFSPNVIKGNRLMSWAVPWSVPYRIMNFVYLTTPEIRYIIVDDDDADPDSLADKLEAALPQKIIEEEDNDRIMMNKEVVNDLVGIEDKNNYKVRVVFFTDTLNDLQSDTTPSELQYLKGDLTAINVKVTSGGINGYGQITFYKQDGTSFDYVKTTAVDSTTDYLGLQSLIAAVFAEDIDSYNCNMKRAFKKMEFMTGIYESRTTELKDNHPDPTCTLTYLGAAGYLTTIKSKAGDLSEVLDSSDINDIYDKVYDVDSLNNSNDRAQKLSCPEIY